MSPFQERALQTQIIYGPVISRRLGRSLGVNILPTEEKICSFDCVYCQYGFSNHQYNRSDIKSLRLPSPVAIAEALRDALTTIEEMDVITLAGNGEPTLHPSFKQITEVVARLRDNTRPGLPICILSNSSTVNENQVQLGLQNIDRKIMKLDAGREVTFCDVNRPRQGVTLKKIVGGLAKLDNVEIQTLFFKGRITNASDEEIKAWLDKLEVIKPVGVQVYSLDRQPADQNLVPLSQQELREIAERARIRLPNSRIEVY